MTENIPPIPPAPLGPPPTPQHQGPNMTPQQFWGYGQPSFRAPGSAPQAQSPAPYGYEGQQNPYGQPQGGYPPQAPAVQYVLAQSPGQWAPARPQSSGYRVAAGVVQIVLGLWLFFPMAFGFSVALPFMGLLFLVGLFGNVTAGIILLAKHRSRTPGAAVTTLAFAGFAVLLSLLAAAGLYGTAMTVLTLPLAAPTLVVMGLGLAKERRGYDADRLGHGARVL